MRPFSRALSRRGRGGWAPCVATAVGAVQPAQVARKCGVSSNPPPPPPTDTLDNLFRDDGAHRVVLVDGTEVNFDSVDETTQAVMTGVPVDKVKVAAIAEDTGRNMLHRCAADGHAELLTFAIEAAKKTLSSAELSAAVSTLDKEGFAPLHLAAKSGSVACIKQLVTDAGAAVSQLADSETYQRCSPLFVAAVDNQAAAIDALVELGADPTGPPIETGPDNQRDMTPLHAASLFGAAKACEALLRAGADANAKAADGSTPLFNAAGAGAQEVVGALLTAGANMYVVTTGGLDVLQQCILNGHDDVLEELMDRGANVRQSTFYTGVVGGSLRAAGLVARAPGVDMNAAQPLPDNAMFSEGLTPLGAVLLNHKDTGHLQVLLDKGADPNKTNVFRDVTMTPLHFAAIRQNVSAFKMLLECGADRTVPDSNGMTPDDVAKAIGLSGVLSPDG